MSQNLIRLFFGVLFFPAVLLLHECGHYFASAVLGLPAHFHFAEVTTIYPQPLSLHAFWLVATAGPAVEAILAIGGCFWLWHLRHNRAQAAATCMDWLATFPALCAARWLRCFTGTPGQPQPPDEAALSASFGFPKWFFPYLLAPVAIVLLIGVVRLHPRGARLVPFASAVLGGCLGLVLWVRVFGPRILP
jgi:hypothetical protein